MLREGGVAKTGQRRRTDCTMAGLGGHVAIRSDTMGSGVHCGGLGVRAPCRMGGRWQRRGCGPNGREAPGLQRGCEVWEVARPCGDAAADVTSRRSCTGPGRKGRGPSRAPRARWRSGHHWVQSGDISIDDDEARCSSGVSVPWESMLRGPRWRRGQV